MRPRTTLLIAALGLLVPGLLCVATAAGGDVTPDQLPTTSAPGAGPAQGAPARPTTGSEDASRVTAAAPRRARALRGRAVDADRTPLPGVHVELLLDGQPAAASARCATRTDARGSFVLELEPGDPTALTLLLHGTGQAPTARGVAAHVDAAQVDLGDVVLSHGGTIAGSVLGEQGQPRLGAQVLLRPAHGPLLRLPDAVLDRLLPAVHVDGDGRFAFTTVPAAAYALEATAPGSQAHQLPLVPVRDGETTRLPPLLLVPGHTLRGQVFDPEGRPLAGASVDLAVAGPDAARRLRRSRTDADGAFEFGHLAPGPHHLRVAWQGLLTWTRRDLDPRFDARADVRLERGATLRGRVREAATGRDLGDFRVRLHRADDPRDLAAAPAEARRAQEFTRLSSTAEGAWRPTADPQEVAAALRDLAAQEAQRRAERIAAWPFGPEPERVWPGADRAGPEAGGFAFPGLEDGLWLVEVEVKGRPRTRVGPVLVRAGAGPTQVDVVVGGR